jgi:transposase-like protein
LRKLLSGRRFLDSSTLSACASRSDYVRGEVHTNSIESFWSLLKRGVVGTYHNVSAKYLPFYLNEFSFRFNNRKNEDMFADLITTCSQ